MNDYLHAWRAAQHDDQTLPADVEQMRFLGSVTRNRAQRDLTNGLGRDERALLRFHRGAA